MSTVTSNGIVDLEKYFGQKRVGRAFDFGFAGVESAANQHLSLPPGSILSLMAEA